MLNGNGTKTQQNGNMYDGNQKDNMPDNGYVEYTYKNGDVHECK